MKPRWLPLLAPVALLLAIRIVPLAAGESTLFLRDVLRTHLALRATLAEGLRSGTLPILDALRAGGQPLAGNPNAVPFYPDNLLLLVASPLWQLNAHFWLHWLVALWGAIWLARAWGLGREGAVAAGATYAFSGFFLSQLNLYNAVAPVALAPALAAAVLETSQPGKRTRGLAAAGILFALALLGGDPILAGVGLVAALALAAANHRSSVPWGRVALVIGCGVLIATPQIVETLRILDASYRGFWGYDIESQARSAPNPRAAIDLLFPLYFGRPDLRAVWGTAYFGGYPPLYFSLAPGWIAIALAGVALGRNRRSLVPVALVLVGLVATFSGGTLLPEALAAIPGGKLLRFPVKLMLLAALGGSLLVGMGLERALEGARRRALTLWLMTILILGIAAWGVLSAAGPRALAWLPSEGLRAESQLGELTRWSGVLLLSCVATTVAIACWWWLPRRLAVPALIAIHVGGQALLLGPMVPTDDMAPYRIASPLAEQLPRAARLAHAGVGDLFGPGWETAARPPDNRTLWLARRAQAELFPFSGRQLGFAYELDIAPEGLDAFVTYALAQAMRGADDARRLAVLEALGVDKVLVYRDLDPAALAGRARLEAIYDIAGGETRVYGLLRPLPAAWLFGSVRFAPTMNDAMAVLYRPGFDALAFAVVAGSGEPREGPPGSVELLVDDPEHVLARVRSEKGGFLVLRRAHLPVWRARVDGGEAPVRIAQATRLAVEVPAGEHEVELVVPRAPLRWAAFGSLLGLLGVLLVAGVRRR